MIDFIGDLSKKDAEVLKELAETHNRIVEFGSGGSTQILGHYTSGNVISYDTQQLWIDKTKDNLERLDIDNVSFRYFNRLPALVIPDHDLLFIDGYRPIRTAFASIAFGSCKKTIAFHDNRKRLYTDPILEFLKLYWNSVRKIDVNYLDSNITVIHLREEPLEYMNWNVFEGRTREQIGIA